MNPDNGHLMTGDEIARRVDFAKMFPEKKPFNIRDYLPVPEKLRNAADKKLAGAPEAYVSLTSGGKLSSFCAKERKKRKAKNKQAAASRKRNR